MKWFRSALGVLFGETKVNEDTYEWPKGWPRTPDTGRRKGRWSGTLAFAAQELKELIRAQGSKDLVISCIIPQPYPDDVAELFFGDPGVVIRFKRRRGNKYQELVMACDRWSRPRDNLKALTSTLRALAKIDYWGCTEIMERAFDAFAALPAPHPKSCWEVLGLDVNATNADVKRAYRSLAKTCHSDTGGNTAKMSELNVARDQALEANAVWDNYQKEKA